MKTHRYNILTLGYFTDGFIEELKRKHHVTCIQSRNDERVLKMISDTEWIIIRSPFVLTDIMIERAIKLKRIVRAGSGIDFISPKYLEKNIPLDVIKQNHDAVAELAILLTLAALRKFMRACDSIQNGKWLKNQLIGRQIKGKTVGILGYGSIGRRYGELARAFGGEIITFDRSVYKKEKQDALKQLQGESVNLDDLYKRSDILLISMPYEKGNEGLINKKSLDGMKRDVVIVNVARGQLVDEKDLYDFLKRQTNATYATDVYKNEPWTGDSLNHLDNFMGTPHIGAQTMETRHWIEREVLNRIEALET